MKNLYILLLLAFGASSCGSTTRAIFSKKTGHEAYREVLDDTDLDKTPMGKLWLSASDRAVNQPQEVALPYSQIGNFAFDKPRALGLRFTAQRGERLNFKISKQTPFVLYLDLFNATGQHLMSVDTNSRTFSVDATSETVFILRLQPELMKGGRYALEVSVGPSLGFPVAGKAAKTGSFWGAQRDGGARSHEGIDIFAPKGTPVIAATDGYVSSVREGGLGGKQVWLRSKEQNISLYYAHLDKQLVEEGSEVKIGDTLGTVGNTGNARNTPPHLHFGIYTFGGAIDPWPFVKKDVRNPSSIKERTVASQLQLTKALKVGDVVIPANTVLTPVAQTASGYIAELPDGSQVQTSFSQVKTLRSA